MFTQLADVVTAKWCGIHDLYLRCGTKVKPCI